MTDRITVKDIQKINIALVDKDYEQVSSIGNAIKKDTEIQGAYEIGESISKAAQLENRDEICKWLAELASVLGY